MRGRDVAVNETVRAVDMGLVFEFDERLRFVYAQNAQQREPEGLCLPFFIAFVFPERYEIHGFCFLFGCRYLHHITMVGC